MRHKKINTFFFFLKKKMEGFTFTALNIEGNHFQFIRNGKGKGNLLQFFCAVNNYRSYTTIREEAIVTLYHTTYSSRVSRIN